MIDALDVKGAMISVDALNTQKETASKIVDPEVEYTLSLMKIDRLKLKRAMGESPSEPMKSSI